MAHIKRKYIDKHWLTFIFRGGLALVFSWFAMFGQLNNFPTIISAVSIFLLAMGIVDSLSALYCQKQKHGWLASVVDAAIDIIASVILIYAAKDNVLFSFITISAYIFISGIIDILHSFVSTVDPTDKFIRIIAGICGCVMGLVTLNIGSFEISAYIRFFGVYMIIVGITSLIYGVHNRSQFIEDKEARKESAKKAKKSSKKSTSKKVAKKSK